MTFTKPTNKEWGEAVEKASKLPDELKSVYQPQSFAELIDTYPEAKMAAKRAAKARIRLMTENISSLSEFREIWSNEINKMHHSQQPPMIAWLNEKIEEYRMQYEKEIKKCYFQIEYLHNLGKPVPEERKNDITPERIERARSFPITDLMEVKRGQAKCLWHDDHRPSMKVYPDNHAYCFSCCHRADVIDIHMALTGGGFQESVRYLAP